MKIDPLGVFFTGIILFLKFENQFGDTVRSSRRYSEKSKLGLVVCLHFFSVDTR